MPPSDAARLARIRSHLLAAAIVSTEGCERVRAFIPRPADPPINYPAAPVISLPAPGPDVVTSDANDDAVEAGADSSLGLENAEQLLHGVSMNRPPAPRMIRR